MAAQTPHKLFKLRKDATKIAGLQTDGNGTVRHSEAGQAVHPSGTLRVQKTCIISVAERLVFQLEEATTTKVPTMGAHGATEFTADELTGGTARGAGIKGTAALSTVESVDKTFNGDGKPVIEVSVIVESADDDSGVDWTAGSDPNA